MIGSQEDIIEVSNMFKAAFKNPKMIAFIEQVGFINKGTYSGDKDIMMMNEGKREVALTIKTLVEEPIDEILKHFYQD